MHATLHRLTETRFPALLRRRLETLQVNLGYRCNQRRLHCHVNAGPTRSEQMNGELNPHFRRLARMARALGAHVIDRCNLTILAEPGQEDLAEFLAA